MLPKKPSVSKAKSDSSEEKFPRNKTVFIKVDLDLDIIPIAENYRCHFVKFVKVTLNNDL